MKHYGDITKLNGANVPPVSIITAGSPCQDLSVAGKRAGLGGERSGLFMEQIRVIKEMRENDRNKGRTDELIRPRYMVWENVPGALSSNGGEDFRVVLEETARVADENAVIPGLEKGQNWTSSGCILGDGWSIAWRIHDAQFWGVPQRRKRIALIADFGGTTASEILFERKSMSRDIEESGEEGQRVTEDVERSVGETSAVVYRKKGHPQNAEQGQGWEQTKTSDTLNIFDNSESRTPTIILENHPNDSRVKISEDGKVQTLSSRMGTGGGNVPMVMEESYNTTARYYKDPQIVCNSVIRRLTPLECERLQGFPDRWTNIGEWVDSKGKKHKDADSPRYKALGNSIALPFWEWMAKRMAAHLPQGATMASLFDGIGGFPLAYQRAGIKPVWASEIEEFPIAVTKKHFKEEI